MTKADTLSKKGKSNQKNNHKMGVRDGLVAKKANQSKQVAVKNNVPMKAKNKGKGKNVVVPQNVGKNKNNKQGQKKKESKPKVEESEEEEDSEVESEESMEESPQKKGVKMFEGVQDSDDDDEDEDDDSEGMDEDDDDDDDEDDDDDDDEDEEEEGETADVSKQGLKALLGKSIEDDDDDEDFEGNDESDDSDAEATATFDKKLRSKSQVKDEDDDDDDEDKDEDEDEDDDDDEDESEEEEDEKAPGLKALLGDSLADEEDDSDFDDKGQDDDDDDEDISDESDDEDTKKETSEKSTPPKKKKADQESPKPKQLSPEEQAKLDARTVFVGNVPKDTTPKVIKQFFRPCGEIENVRVRGVVSEDSRISPRVATITKKMHPKVQTVYVYIAFKEEAAAKKALEYNGKKLGDNIIRVDISNKKDKVHDQKKAVFLGNLPFDITEDEIHEHFTSCGKIESVRLIKDRRTGLSRGVGYINFVEADSVALALELNDTKLKGREVRVKNSSPSTKEKKRKQGKNQGNEQSGKKFKTAKGEAKDIDGAGKSDKKKRSQGEKKRGKSSGSESSSPAKSPFQGQQAGDKKKSKKNKLDKKKKIMSEKLTATKKSKATA